MGKTAATVLLKPINGYERYYTTDAPVEKAELKCKQDTIYDP